MLLALVEATCFGWRAGVLLAIRAAPVTRVFGENLLDSLDLVAEMMEQLAQSGQSWAHHISVALHGKRKQLLDLEHQLAVDVLRREFQFDGTTVEQIDLGQQLPKSFLVELVLNDVQFHDFPSERFSLGVHVLVVLAQSADHFLVVML